MPEYSVNQSATLTPGAGHPGREACAALARALGLPVTGTAANPVFHGTIRGSDLGTLVRLDLSGQGITDLTGLQYVVNLEYLSLARNSVSDLSLLVPGKDNYLSSIGMPRLRVTGPALRRHRPVGPADSWPMLTYLSMDGDGR